MSYTVAVRTLCEFTAKCGDLDLRFTPAPTAAQGIAGHTQVTSRRGANYQTEVSLSGSYKGLVVRGRADGYDPARQQLEEIKTYRGDLSRQPDNHRQLHWAQAKIYAWLLCQQLALPALTVALVYFDIGSGRETLISEHFSAPSLEAFFELHCQRFLAFAEQESAHRLQRDQALTALRFPHGEFRASQRELAEAVYKAACTGQHLLAQAPTGIGKTIGTLFAQLKACPSQGLDKLFFLAAKTPGRSLALQALANVQDSAPTLSLRVVELIARDKACEHPDKACHGESCPLARGFYDRLPAARAQALTTPKLARETLRQVALTHAVCPYYLTQELVRWSDVVVGDYNYFFDLNAMLYGMTLANEWRVGVLVDEAHNLIERARAMYTAELVPTSLRLARRAAPTALKKPLERLARSWREAARAQTEAYTVYPAAPPGLINALLQTVAAIADYFAEFPNAIDAALQDFYFEALHFCRILESFDSHSLFDISLQPAVRGAPDATICLRNVVPADLLKPRFAATHSSVLFSATLSPTRFYRDLLGLDDATPTIDVSSPFDANQLAVHIVDRVSTRFAQRAASVAPLADIIAQEFARSPGNYLAFFSSYAYLEQVAAQFRQHYPDVTVWQQMRQMDESARAEFLQRFTTTSAGIGFAVLGGAFGEAVDLPGTRLIGAFIATLGQPQINAVNEQIKQRLEQLFGAGQGYDYAYFFPGLQKVVQAAGRVIRTPTDTGAVFLIDERFAKSRVRHLLPNWWRPQRYCNKTLLW